MILDGRIDHLVGDMTPLTDMYSSLVGEARRSLEWSSITRPDTSLMLQVRKEKKQKNMSDQRTSKKSQKAWRLLHF